MPFLCKVPPLECIIAGIIISEPSYGIIDWRWDIMPLLRVPALECIITGTIISEPSYGRMEALDVLRDNERGLE